jgi:RNA polymerase sigma-70 factor (ECF subfamily)
VLPPGTLARVVARDPQALGELFDAYFDRVFALVHRLLGDRTLAEDATSEVFFKVQRAAHTIDPSRDPAPWIMTVATNVCRDLWRSGAYRMRQRSRPVDDDPATGPSLATREPGPAEALETAERQHLVREALQELPEPMRVAIVLHDYEGLSHQEVADRTGIEHAAARKRYSRALTALASLLREKGL